MEKEATTYTLDMCLRNNFTDFELTYEDKTFILNDIAFTNRPFIAFNKHSNLFGFLESNFISLPNQDFFSIVERTKLLMRNKKIDLL